VNPLDTVPHQGAKSLSEIELNMKRFGYGEDAGMDVGATKERVAANVKKVLSLAARWSFDPTAIHEHFQSPADGIAGKSSRFLSGLGCGCWPLPHRAKNRKETHVIQH
jgi:hypothetical protein